MIKINKLLKENLKLKKICLIDGKFYNHYEIQNIKEDQENIYFDTEFESIATRKNAISRIIYYKGTGADDEKNRDNKIQ